MRTKGKIIRVFLKKAPIFAALSLMLIIGVFSPRVSFADLEDVEAAQKKAKQNFISHFFEFTKDKNVHGKAKTPEGKVSLTGSKRRFDNDGGGFMLYQSDLTYHDYAYSVTDPFSNEDDKKKAPRLFWWVSSHGGVPEAGGSSHLERIVYKAHKNFSNEEEEKAKEKDKQKGVQYRSIYKINTREVIDKNSKDKDAEPDKIERVYLRDEVKKEIQEAGKLSFETIKRAGRDKENQDDSQALPNGVLLRYAAGTATQAWWNSTLANLGQRRANKAVNGIVAGGLVGSSPRLNEGIPSCKEWETTAMKEIDQIKDPEKKKAFVEEIQKRSQQCQQVTGLPYSVVNPRFVQEDQDKGENLKALGPKKEDSFERDLRNQLQILAKAGRKAEGLTSNWKYGAEDDQSRVTIDFDDKGQPKGEVSRTVEEQLQSYNNQLKEAAEGYEEIKSRYPGFKPESNPMDFQIQPNTRSAMDINGSPVLSAFEEVNIPKVQGPIKPPTNYNDLIEQK